VVGDHGVPPALLHRVDRPREERGLEPWPLAEVHADQEACRERLAAVGDDDAPTLLDLAEHRRRGVERQPLEVLPVEPEPLDERARRSLDAYERDGAVEVGGVIAPEHGAHRMHAMPGSER
jgi:hypothetical protein